MCDERNLLIRQVKEIRDLALKIANEHDRRIFNGEHPDPLEIYNAQETHILKLIDAIRYMSELRNRRFEANYKKFRREKFEVIG